MIVFCDQLTFRAAYALAKQRLSAALPAGTRVALLDGSPDTPRARCASALLSVLGFKVAEVAFFAGHLKTRTGEGVGPAAAKLGFQLADRSASLIIRRSALLRRVNAAYPRDSVRLRLAKQLWLPSLELWTRILVADALARASGAGALLIVTWPAMLPRGLQGELEAPLEVLAAGQKRPGWKSGRLSALLWAVRQWVRRLLTRRRAARTDGHLPALLTLQEDDLSFDRSFRSQPHWLNLDAPGAFRTVVLRAGRTADVHLTPAERTAARIETIEIGELAAASGDAPIARQTRRDGLKLCLRAAFARDAAESWAAGEVARLLLAAGEMAQLSVEHGVVAFLTCENYQLHADAMQLVAPALGIRTLSYQYSNMTHPSLPMLSTADELLTFAPMFHSRFTWPGFTPPAFTNVGYVFESSFELAGPRAAARRERMQAAGAKFVIGFFDESIQRDKYGWVSADDHEAELRALVELVLGDPSVGLVIKTQFHHNIQLASSKLKADLAEAERTGRLEMPSHGRHRNSVLPCEVAASSDITIGHVFGGSASLESALAGSRSVMVNSLGIVSLADPLYARAQIVLPSMDAVLAAIAALRRGDPGRQALGDWTPILSEFDVFRDGRSADRFRAAVESAVLRARGAPGRQAGIS
ncbi:MAG TPA: hypothetical protein VNJ03_08730 [Vicinamibacterales bacterium]|nr:hypothetical protein [Vicinamibacterales bacterium]